MRLLGMALLVAGLLCAPAMAAQPTPEKVLANWYRMVLELVRHTPTYSPPVASRSFAYLGVTAYEATASGNPAMQSLAGQLTDLGPLPAREGTLDDAMVLHAALSEAVTAFFGNTGPTGQRAMQAMDRQLDQSLAEALDPDVAARSEAYGRAVAAHVIAWSEGDGKSVVENLGFPLEYTLGTEPWSWVPTSGIPLQQAPLLPGWREMRPFVIPAATACPLPPPPAYSEEPGSAFYAEAMEVKTARENLTDEQKLIARFWSDDPMLSPTPPGHWIAIVMQIAARDGLDNARSTDALARVGIAVADGFIANWDAKYQYDLLRPITYIRRVIDPKWETLLITPPFPEYPSGHSTQSGAAAAVLTAIFGEDFAFTDSTHVDDGLPERSFPDFWAAAEEAALSRLYGGIHFRSAIEKGLEQGRCVGAHAIALETLR